MKTTEQGRLAESAVAKELSRQSYKISELNWRTRLCEIDIIARKKDIVYFVEVKYRSSNSQGDGFEYITGAKLRQMKFAAQLWVQQNDWLGDWRLLAAAVSGDNAEKIEFLEID